MYSQKIKTANVRKHPYPHITIENFFEINDLKLVKDTFDAEQKNFEYNCESYWGGSGDKEFCDLIYQIGSKQIYDTLNDVFAVKNKTEYESHIFDHGFKLDTKDTELQTQWHRDQGMLFSMQVFFSDNQYENGGTQLCSNHDIQHDVIEHPLKHNFCTIWPCVANSWHRVEQRGYERKSVLMRWVNPKRLEMEEKQSQDVYDVEFVEVDL